jgi:phosphosulfolactate phosphohydrolase-like enzyme
MARNVNGTVLINRIRELGEIRSAYVNDAAMLTEINQSRLELFDKLITVGAGDYAESTQLVNVVSGTASYSLPDDYYKTIAVDINSTDGNWCDVSRYSLGERNLFSDLDSYNREDVYYRIRGNDITFAPTPNWTETNSVKHSYVAVPADITAATSVDGVAGWEDWIVYDCLVKFVGGKEEGDASQWERQLAKLNARIDGLKQRDRNEPDRIIVRDE